MKRALMTAALAAAVAAPLAGAPFEDLQLGVRPQGMGGAFVALADDANAVYWNPAGTAQLRQQQATFMHGLYGGVDGLSIDYLGYVYPMRYTALGVAWAGLGAKLEQGENAQSSSYGESTWILNYAVNPALFGNDQLLLGANVKRLTLDSALGGGAGLGLDFGLLFKPFSFLQGAVVGRNVAANVKDENLRSTIRAGLASRFWGDRIRLAVDLETVNNVNDSSTPTALLHYGLELQPISYVALRAGMDDGHWTAGGGLAYRQFGLDYAFYSTELFGNAHRMGLSVQFGPEAGAPLETMQAKGPGGLKPPQNLKGGYVGGRVVLFWDASTSRQVAGYNFYVRNNLGEWVKANQDTIPAERLGASIDAEKGARFTIAVTAVNLDGDESLRSTPITIDAR